MSDGSFSVIVPAFGQAEYLGAALRSALDQRRSALEVIVVDDASPDRTAEVVRSIDDERLRYIEHERNRGPAAARNTGIRAARGDLVAFLDADDLFHPHKLAAHGELLDAHPEVGASYNARYVLDHSAETVRDLWIPPAEVGLAELIGGWPFAPSDLVVRRRWIVEAGLFDEELYPEDLDFFCRLALAGCRFARVERALNRRRFHSARRFRGLDRKARDYRRTVDRVVADPRCPPEVRSLRDRALARHLFEVVCHALRQEETELARRCLQEVLRVEPALLDGRPAGLLWRLLDFSLRDESERHPEVLARMVGQLPSELAGVAGDVEQVVAHGYLVRAARTAMWGRPERARRHQARAAEAGARADGSFLEKLAHQLTILATERGDAEGRRALTRVLEVVEGLGGARAGRSLRARYALATAFDRYRRGDFAAVPRWVAEAGMAAPSALADRGVWSILGRSVARQWRNGGGTGGGGGSRVETVRR